MYTENWTLQCILKIELYNVYWKLNSTMYIENWTLQCILTIELLFIFVPDTYAADNYLFRLGNVFPPTDGETHYQVL